MFCFINKIKLRSKINKYFSLFRAIFFEYFYDQIACEVFLKQVAFILSFGIGRHALKEIHLRQFRVRSSFSGNACARNLGIFVSVFFFFLGSS